MPSQRQQAAERTFREPGQPRCVEAIHYLPAFGEASDLFEDLRARGMMSGVAADEKHIDRSLGMSVLVH